MMKSISIIMMLTASASADLSAAENIYNQGQNAYNHGDYAMAIVSWQETLKLAPLATDILFDLAQAYRLKGDCTKALAAYRQFLTSTHPADRYLSLANEFVRSLEGSCEIPKIIVAPAKTAEPVVLPRVVRLEHRESSQSSMRLVGLLSASAGFVSLIVGLEFSHHASTINSHVTSTCAVSCDWSIERDQVSASHRDLILGYTFDAFGVGAMLTGAALYYVGAREHGFTVQPHAHGTTLSWDTSW